MANFLGQLRDKSLSQTAAAFTITIIFQSSSSLPKSFTLPSLPPLHTCPSAISASRYHLGLLVVLLLLFCNSKMAALVHADSYEKFTETNALYSP